MRLKQRSQFCLRFDFSQLHSHRLSTKVLVLRVLWLFSVMLMDGPVSSVNHWHVAVPECRGDVEPSFTGYFRFGTGAPGAAPATPTG